VSYDREKEMPVITYSSLGGNSIERISEKKPESIHYIHIDYKEGLKIEDVYPVCENLGLK
jgi:succinyl-CoA synthetase beta subunit